MLLLTWNIRHGGGFRIPAILAAIAGHQPDLVVLTEFRDNRNGPALRQGLADLGLVHQAALKAPAGSNTVLIASRQPFGQQAFPGLGADSHRCILATLPGLNVLGVYFPQKQAKAGLFRFLLGLDPRYLREPTVIIGDFNTGEHRLDKEGATFKC